MRFWRKIVRNYFTFNNREKRGLLVLLVFLFLLVVTHLAIRLTPDSKIELSDKQKALVSALNAVNEKQQSVFEASNQSLEIDTQSVITPIWKRFDPNHVDFNTLKESGLDSNVARRLIKYRQSGGRFDDVSDVQKIYGMKNEWILEARSYMRFQDVPEDTIHTSRYQKTNFDDTSKVQLKSKTRFELNTVDSATLEALPWVGPFYAGEIVKLRENLGGFRSYDQLLYVYNMRDEAIQVILENSSLDTTLVEKIDLNRTTIQQLGYHPYLSWKQAKIILNYRINHGPFKSKKEILKTRVISDSVYLKIAPYLKVGDDN